MKTWRVSIAGAWLVAVGACGGTVLLGSPVDGGPAETGDPSRGDAGNTVPGDDGGTGDDTVGDDAAPGDDTVGDDAAPGDDAVGDDASRVDGTVADDVGTGDDTVGDAGGGDLDASFDAAILDAPLADASSSPIETFEFIMRGVVQTPMSCQYYHWQFAGVDDAPTPDVYIRNTGDVPLTYIAAPEWDIPGMYKPGVPAPPSPDVTGTLSPGESVNITAMFLGGFTALLGAPKPFSVYPDGSFEAQDEGQIPWPQGVPNATGASTMFIAQVYVAPSCEVQPAIW